MINPYTFPIKGDISRADAVVLYQESFKRSDQGRTILEFGPGASTIFLAAGGNSVHSLEHDSKWLDRIRKNIDLYKKKGIGLNVFAQSIDFEKGMKEADRQIKLSFQSFNPGIIYIDCLRSMRELVLDRSLEWAPAGTLIMYHDCFSPQHQETFGRMIPKYSNKIESVHFHYRGSNILKIEVGHTYGYQNWQQTENRNHRIDWFNDKTGLE